ncbi:pyridoxamine 5'-phosphate oxidase family protein [Haloarcula salinisoli]|uniref:Pyridoxamine 5'-phosphate oxidase family protein n=1 Tax=Haloarcula salinisoli TaxID=2487746 RepID=A0A8J7YLK2_9EURY|nr:pyridoxamine 5'-phosphate oxidase family protein [Halomicroarcula salinisoli]MBX0287428.1 pyridoxamine 5'-phosphate oxidase family protein [Halomicroarcula salinisoli]MBX0304999.1 pyridoxamine 5'-phosphate oxidase family protein [Halomicroarcula salinisoli]
MVSVTGVWSREDLAAFLEDQTAPLRLGCRRPRGDLWMLSLWYRYRDGTFECATAADADVVSYLDHDTDVSFEVSTNDPPYRGVRGNGTATVTTDEEKAVLRALIERYLGGTDSDLAQRLLAPSREEVRIRIEPDRLHSWDYSERM